PGFRKLNQATRDLLDEFRRINGDKVQYQFINPDDMPDAQSKQNLYKQLQTQGLNPINLEVKKEDQVSQRVIFPGAVVTFNNKSMPVELLQQQLGNVSPEEILHNSIIGLEYQMTNAIRKLQAPEKPKVAIIQGHGELKKIETADLYKTLSEYYTVDYVNLPQYKVGSLDPYAAIIIAKPDSFFTELEKYKIDQYIMHGGKVLWCVETLAANMDSLKDGVGFTYDYKTNLFEDFLFKYGVRLNYDLVQDLNCNYIPLVTPYGQQQQKQLLKWPYYPVVVPQSPHPIVHNLNAIWFSFASTMDIIDSRNNEEVKKTILLQTSPYTRVLLNPVRINLSLVATLQREQPLYRQGPKNLAVLLEGNFNSNFVGRISPEALASGEYGDFKPKSKATKQIVISDGDVIRNQVSKSKAQIYPLGFDQYSNQTFGNKNFVLNCIDYMVDESGLMSLRAKDYRLRLLNTGRIKTERFNWQMLNMVLPLVLIGIFGLIFNYVRKRRFAS
ncbi:MAG: gliding motility-associated ABC transporter substrate-binding protein GldG, partial [Sphingobacteriales bacterium]